MWMSPQSFSQDWMEEFYGLIEAGAGLAGRHRLRTADA